MDFVINDTNKKYNFLWVALMTYAIIYTAHLHFGHIPMARLFYAVIGFAVVVFLLANISFDFSNRDTKTRVIYFLLVLWLAAMFLRSDFSFYYSPNLYGVLSYAGVLLMMLKPRPIFCSLINYGFKANYLYPLIFFFPMLLTDNGITQMFLETFPVIAAYIFMTNKYHSNRNIFLSFAVLMLALLAASLEARRNLMLTYTLYMAFGSVMLFINGKVKSIETRLLIAFTAALMLIGSITFYKYQSAGMFSNITGRATENTREEVLVSYAIDMANTTDLVLGRGMSGVYYCPGVDEEVGSDEYEEYREHIECGYLEWILKGGIVYLFLYLILFILAIWQGFKSNNALSKASAAIAFVQLVDMAPFGLHAFNMKMFMIWIAVSICLDKNIRKMTDDEIRAEFFTIKRKILPWMEK